MGLEPMTLIAQNISPIKIMKTLISSIFAYLPENNERNFVSNSARTRLEKTLDLTLPICPSVAMMNPYSIYGYLLGFLSHL